MLATPTYRWYRVSKPTAGVVCGLSHERCCITLTENTTIRVAVRHIRNSNPLVPIEWEGKLVMLFKQDFQRNTTPIDQSGGVALGVA
jgi:hypothetical protein